MSYLDLIQIQISLKLAILYINSSWIEFSFHVIRCNYQSIKKFSLDLEVGRWVGGKSIDQNLISFIQSINQSIFLETLKWGQKANTKKLTVSWNLCKLGHASMNWVNQSRLLPSPIKESKTFSCLTFLNVGILGVNVYFTWNQKMR